jgi:hypothetical protein
MCCRFAPDHRRQGKRVPLMDEIQSELDRHHRDFAAISVIVHNALSAIDGIDYGDTYIDRLEEALRAIRRIVG